MQNDKLIKVYVPVTVDFDKSGRIVPKTPMWEDGRKYEIDKVIECKPAASMRAGGQGDRYTIQVNGQQRYLFFERSTNITGNQLGCWFVERRAG